MASNGGVMGGIMRILPKSDFQYETGVFESSITANGSLQGGVIDIRAGNNSAINLFGNFTKVTANGTSPTLGRGGFIHLNAVNNNVHNGRIEATGGLQNGQVIFTTGN